MSARPIVVTRPGEPGRQLARDLAATGLEALWLPAFTLGPPPDPQRVAVVLADLAAYQLAIFVSVPAVEAVAAALRAPWPTGTAVGVVGGATRRAVAQHIASAAGARWFAPDTATDGEGGSEALWHVLRASLSQFRRVLLLRAQHGREWLGEKLASAGIEVETLAVYSRATADPGRADAERLRRWQSEGRPPVVVITSSEAVEVIRAQLAGVGGDAWIASARVLAPHERIVARARAAGFADVRLAPLATDAIRVGALAQ